MRVAVVAEYYPRPDDPVSGIWAHRQALAAHEAGADVRVLVLDRPIPGLTALREAARGDTRRLAARVRAAAGPRTWVRDGIEVEYVRYLSPPRATSYARWHRFARRPLAAALERARCSAPIDLVHAHYAHLAGAAALPWAQRRGVPLAVSVHGGDVLAPSLAGPHARATVGRVLAAARVVMCNSEGTRRLAAEMALREDNMRVVHLGTDVPADAGLPPKHERPTVATLAHAIPRKRHEDVLGALALLSEEVRWSVIGDGPVVPGLRTLADELGVRERVSFHGQLAPREAHEELARCHAMALPSEGEAFGVAYVEALARGVPAIGCAGQSGPEEIAGLGGGMLLVPPRDPAALAAAIERVLGDSRLAHAARENAAANFTWEACGRATFAAYEAALG